MKMENFEVDFETMRVLLNFSFGQYFQRSKLAYFYLKSTFSNSLIWLLSQENMLNYLSLILALLNY